MLTATIFFDKSLYKEGDNFCYYCGAKCDNSYSTKDFVKDIFSGRDSIPYPNSEYVCTRCAESFSENSTIEMIDGEIRTNQRIRQYSWFITNQKKLAFTKAHIHIIRDILLNIPDPPFTFIFAESGQKHLIYRSKIALDKNEFYVMLEDNYILVNVEKLNVRIKFLEKLIAVFGKVAILGELSISLGEKLFALHGKETENILEKFEKIKNEELTKLAVWLSPNKEECLRRINDGEINT